MPAVTKEQPLFASSASKKRRLDEKLVSGVPTPIFHFARHDDSSYIETCHGDGTYITNAQPRRIAPLPASKRLRVSNEEKPRSTSRSVSPATSHPHRTSPSASPTREAPQPTGGTTTRPSPTRATSNPLLSRCHICHRKPTKKSDLDSFADCQGCGQRTCFVCLRQCPDWRPNSGGGDEMLWTEPTQDLSASFHMEDAEAGAETETRGRGVGGGNQNTEKGQRPQTDGWATGGHRQVVCSRCCVEKGPDGEVVCLGCLPYVGG